jgi:hypothetical protein
MMAKAGHQPTHACENRRRGISEIWAERSFRGISCASNGLSHPQYRGATKSRRDGAVTTTEPFFTGPYAMLVGATAGPSGASSGSLSSVTPGMSASLGEPADRFSSLRHGLFVPVQALELRRTCDVSRPFENVPANFLDPAQHQYRFDYRGGSSHGTATLPHR